MSHRTWARRNINVTFFGFISWLCSLSLTRVNATLRLFWDFSFVIESDKWNYKMFDTDQAHNICGTLRRLLLVISFMPLHAAPCEHCWRWCWSLWPRKTKLTGRHAMKELFRVPLRNTFNPVYQALSVAKNWFHVTHSPSVINNTLMVQSKTFTHLYKVTINYWILTL